MEWSIQSLQISSAAPYPGLALQRTNRVDFSQDLPLVSGSKLERASNCDAWNQQREHTLTLQHKNSGHNKKETL